MFTPQPHQNAKQTLQSGGKGIISNNYFVFGTLSIISKSFYLYHSYIFKKTNRDLPSSAQGPVLQTVSPHCGVAIWCWGWGWE